MRPRNRRLQRELERDVDLCIKKFSTAKYIVDHLKQHHVYSGHGEKKLIRLVENTLTKSSQISQSSSRRQSPKSSKQHSSSHDDDDVEEEEEEDISSISPSRSRKRKKRIDSEGSSKSSSDLESERPASYSAVSTSDDGIYREESNPPDLLKLMMNDRYFESSKKQKIKNIVEIDVDTTNKTDNNKINVMSLSKGGEEGLGAAGVVKKGLEEGKQKPSNTTTAAGGEVNRKNGAPSMFKDLGGMKSLIQELKNKVLIPWLHPEILGQLGVEPISGILLHGPPGCGKTELAFAIANETRVPFYKISAPELVSGVSGASEENIRQLFNKAYKNAPSIIFIDEIDSIASKKESLQRVMEQRIVTELMICMDEHNHRLVQPDESNSDENHPGYVLVIGATNRPDALEPALRRDGRFDREFRLGVPDEKARIEILKALTKKRTLEGSIDLQQIARSTPGFVGTDLKALVREAGFLAMMRIIKEDDEDFWMVPSWSPEDIEKLAITMTDLEQAVKVVQPSLKREGFSSIPNVKWEDVGGLADIRNEFDFHIVGRIKHPEEYQEFGMDLETGILLYGPPGCGKTLIAKAVANEAGANFIYIKGPELLNKYVGESEAAIRTLFERASTCSPCIIFFDEVDVLTTTCGNEGGEVVNRLSKQLLTELDGDDKRRDVFVIGATNKPQVMGPAMLRPGRFGKHLYVPLPSSDDRGMILKALAKGKPIDTTVDLSAIGRMDACNNLSGADLKNLVNEAARLALVESRMNLSEKRPKTIKTAHFEEALKNISPLVPIKQIRNYKAWSRTFKSG